MSAAEPRSSSSDSQDRFWHALWGIAGVAALVYGATGVLAQLTQEGRHPLAVLWFIIAAMGGVSMISFVLRADRDEE